jgi:hypothetical protein
MHLLRCFCYMDMKINEVIVPLVGMNSLQDGLNREYEIHI